MKNPRVADFDPKQEGQELASPLDDMPAIVPPGQGAAPTTKYSLPAAAAATAASQMTETPADSGPFDVSPERPPVRVHRTITRCSFELFLDQMEALRKFSLEEKQQGEAGSMSAMVREAVDAYLAKRHRLDE